MSDWLNDSETLLPHQIQGSPEWHQWRAKHIGASDVPAIMGTCSFRNAYDVFLSKMPDHVPGEQTWPMIRGHALEPVTLARFEKEHNCRLQKPTFEFSIFHVSTDGWWQEDNALVEVKAPALWKHTQALCGLVPDLYYDQVQIGMYITKTDHAYYASLHDGEPESHQYAEVLVQRDEKRIAEIVERCERFWSCVERREWNDNF